MSKTQLPPICVYWWKDEEWDHKLYFHADHANYSFEEFCYYVVLPHLKDLRTQGYNVRFGPVRDSGQTIGELEDILTGLIEG